MTQEKFSEKEIKDILSFFKEKSKYLSTILKKEKLEIKSLSGKDKLLRYNNYKDSVFYKEYRLLMLLTAFFKGYSRNIIEQNYNNEFYCYFIDKYMYYLIQRKFNPKDNVLNIRYPQNFALYHYTCDNDCTSRLKAYMREKELINKEINNIGHLFYYWYGVRLVCYKDGYLL